MHNELLISIGLVIGLGMFAQWLAWRIKQPSIIFLLLLGLGVGPVSALYRGEPILDVEHFLGDLLFPIVSVAVAVILFEGGLSLRLRDLEGVVGVVRRLVSVGVFITLAVSTVAAHYILDLNWRVALLLGATLTVTGPTVIIPLLKQIRPKGRVASILRWEGIVIDPIGAILAVLVFEAIAGPDIEFLVPAILRTLAVGLGIGWLTAQLMIELYRRYWVPDGLQNPITLGLVIGAFAISNLIQPESGLLTVTVMGIVMANQNRFDVHHIVEFKENLQILLLSSLFILLAGRMKPDDLLSIGWQAILFIVVLVIVARPLAAFVSTLGSDLEWQERLFLGWMAPRGIVAASVASIFAIELEELHIEGASALVPLTFAVIIGTVFIYSITAGWLAQYLGLSERNPQGVLIVGGNVWIRKIAQEIKQAGFRVLLSDTNQANARRARRMGLDVYSGNILSEVAQDEINFSGIGRLLALTSNPEVNALAGEHFKSIFGVENVFEVQRTVRDQRDDISQQLGGRTLFPETINYEGLNNLYHTGADVLTVQVQDAPAFNRAVPERIIPLFVMPDKDTLETWTELDAPSIRKGNRVIVLVKPTVHHALIAEGVLEPDPNPVIDDAVALQPSVD